MPSRPSDRTNVSAKVSRVAVKLLDERAEAEGVDRSELIRRLLKYGLAHMPSGWDR